MSRVHNTYIVVASSLVRDHDTARYLVTVVVVALGSNHDESPVFRVVILWSSLYCKDNTQDEQGARRHRHVHGERKNHPNGCAKVVLVYLRTALTQCQSHEFTLECHMTSSGSITQCDVECVFV